MVWVCMNEYKIVPVVVCLSWCCESCRHIDVIHDGGLRDAA